MKGARTERKLKASQLFLQRNNSEAIVLQAFPFPPNYRPKYIDRFEGVTPTERTLISFPFTMSSNYVCNEMFTDSNPSVERVDEIGDSVRTLSCQLLLFLLIRLLPVYFVFIRGDSTHAMN